MNSPTIIEFLDVNGSPKVRKDLPCPLRIGDRIQMSFCLHRMNGGRFEMLEVKGDYRVASVRFEAIEGPKQFLQVEAVGKSAAWRAVKKNPVSPRSWAPCRHPPTTVT